MQIIMVVFLMGIALLFSGCGNANEKKAETINPFNPNSMVNTYTNSKNKINNAVQKENENINNAIEDSGLMK